MVIFGASGDLTQRKLIPALYHLERDGLLSESFAVIGMSREPLTHEAFRDRLSDRIQGFLGSEKLNKDVWSRLVSKLYYQPGAGQDPAAYEGLKKLFDEVSKTHKTGGNGVFYLATPPSLFGPIVQQLGKCGLAHENENGTEAENGNEGFRRVVIEKPFGHDLDSAHALNDSINQVLKESQIYRIDHYLGKETVQNIMVFRFANGIFEPIWNRGYIDSVQITVAETLGVEGRGAYYESSGALRDMVPNHLFQLLSMIAMEPPNSFSPEDVRDEKYKVVKAINALTPEEVLHETVRGQYGDGIIQGKRVPGYRMESGVSPTSATDTFAAMRFTIDNWRWAGVPFYLRTGKRLANRVTEVCIQFRDVPFQLFRETGVSHLPPNRLIIQIQPEERISIQFEAKVPGPTVDIREVHMDFDYRNHFGEIPSTGYETLIYDCMNGDATLFQRGDHVECAWAVIQPILDVWAALRPRDFPNYTAGSWGPREADLLLARDGRQWRFSRTQPQAIPVWGAQAEKKTG
jgi:glucose-6-phosphate 1-dehydrogenase